MAKKKDRDDGGGIAGKIITILFFLILVGGAYYLYGLFKPIEINKTNIAGSWKIAGSPTLYMTIDADDNASSYEQFTAGDTRNKKTYKYMLKENERGIMVLTLKDVKTKETEEIKITRVSQAQMDIIRNGNNFTKFTKTSIF